MTFDDWMLTVAPGHKPSDDSVSLRILRKCWEAAEAEGRGQIAEEVELLRVQLAHWRVFGEHAEGERSRLQLEVQALRVDAELTGRPERSVGRSG